jgi:uncharacterized protein
LNEHKIVTLEANAANFAFSRNLIFVALEQGGASCTAVADGKQIRPVLIAEDCGRLQQRFRDLQLLAAQPLDVWSEILKHTCDAESLIAAGVLEKAHRDVAESEHVSGGTDLDFQVVINSGCNLRCTYCYEGSQTRRNDRVAPGETLREAFEKLTGKAPGLRRITANFLGGEPLLSWKETLNAIEHLHEVAKSRGVDCSMTVQTNLTYIPDGFLSAAKEHRLFVLANIDGDRALHDAQRPHKVPQHSSFDDTVRCLEELRLHEVEFGLRCTITRHNASGLAEIAKLHARLGARVSVFKLLVPVTYSGEGVETLLPDPQSYKEGLERLIAEPTWTDQAWCREFIDTIKAVRDQRAPQSANCSAANPASYTIDQAGHIYNCPNLIGNESFDAGPFAQIDQERRTEVGRLLARQEDPVCGRCSYRFVCTSACLLPKALGGADAQSLMSRTRELQCATTKTIVDDLITGMAHQISSGEAPSLPERRLKVSDLAPEWRTWLLSELANTPAEKVQAALVASGHFSQRQAQSLCSEGTLWNRISSETHPQQSPGSFH